jgi:hypothetical protein
MTKSPDPAPTAIGTGSSKDQASSGPPPYSSSETPSQLPDDAIIAALERKHARGTFEVASDNDRAWFEAHPTRQHRLRAPLPGEHWHWFGDVTRASAVVVFHCMPGLRWRTTVTLTQALESYADDEVTARTVWREIVRKMESTQDMTTST